jgi:hypothetical protein
MYRALRQHRKASSLLVAIAMSFMLFGANGRWICLDGSPCRSDCAHDTSHGGSAVKPRALSLAPAAKCGGCPSSTIHSLAAGPYFMKSRGGCRLSVSAQHDALLSGKKLIFADASALLPVAEYKPSDHSAPAFFILAAPATGPPPLESHSGRAPPNRLLS